MKRIWIYLIGIVIIASGVAVLETARSSDDKLTPVALSANSKKYDSVQALLDASDLVVIARVTSSKEGRIIGSGASEAAIKTKIYTLKIGEVLKGAFPNSDLLLEEEFSLTDGRPLVVNGVSSTKVGDEGMFFLTQGQSDEFPHHALVNQQSRYLVSGQKRDQLTASSNDSLSNRLAQLGPYELRCVIAPDRCRSAGR